MALGKLTNIALEATPERVAAVEECFVAKIGEGVPALTGYVDKKRRLRRIVGHYPCGWRLQVNIDAEGFITSASGKLKLTTPREVKR